MDYYYGSINNEKKIINSYSKINLEFYFRLEVGFNYKEYTGIFKKMFQQVTKIGSPLRTKEKVPYIISDIKSSNY